MSLSVNIIKKTIDFHRKPGIRQSVVKVAPGLCKIQESPFNILRRSFSAFSI